MTTELLKEWYRRNIIDPSSYIGSPYFHDLHNRYLILNPWLVRFVPTNDDRTNRSWVVPILHIRGNVKLVILWSPSEMTFRNEHENVNVTRMRPDLLAIGGVLDEGIMVVPTIARGWLDFIVIQEEYIHIGSLEWRVYDDMLRRWLTSQRINDVEEMTDREVLFTCRLVGGKLKKEALRHVGIEATGKDTGVIDG